MSLSPTTSANVYGIPEGQPINPRSRHHSPPLQQPAAAALHLSPAAHHAAAQLARPAPTEATSEATTRIAPNKMDPIDVEAGSNTTTTTVTSADAAAMVEATHDVAKLRRVLVGGGVGKAAAALYTMLFGAPAGLFQLSGSLTRAYYCVLAAIVLAGVAEAWTGLWLSSHHDGDPAPPPARRRAVGVAVLWASLLPLLLLAAVGGFAVLK